jgi:hypothetical protein
MVQTFFSVSQVSLLINFSWVPVSSSLLEEAAQAINS